ncbi:MAG: carboxypeptidase regulatory-like domain-containing protein [Planctomycetales bacterium]|nr:carboxypeptidase regulatory-like domain-containing protein [Planctomycetales bacterium]
MYYAAGLLFVLAGCGPTDHAEVAGRVTRTDGSPLVGARVTARPIGEGKTVYGTTDNEGNYTLSTGDPTAGVQPGEYEVGISENTGDPERRQKPTIAAKYGNPATSGLTLSVDLGEHKTFDIVVEPR